MLRQSILFSSLIMIPKPSLIYLCFNLLKGKTFVESLNFGISASNKRKGYSVRPSVGHSSNQLMDQMIISVRARTFSGLLTLTA